MLLTARRKPSTPSSANSWREHGDDLGVHRRRRRPDRLGAQLVVLAVAPRLRPLVAEHRAVVPELHRLRPLVQAVLDVRARQTRRRALGAQRHRAPALVLERVHLLAHDVGGLADAALEEPGLLELGRDDAPVAVSAEDARRRRDHVVAQRRLVGQQVVRAFGGARAAHQRCPGSWRRGERNGLSASSRPRDVSGPCPQCTAVSAGKRRTRVATESSRASMSPPGKSVRPTLP